MLSNSKSKKNTKKLSAAYHLSSKFDLLDKSVFEKSKVFFVKTHSIKSSKDLKVQSKSELRQGLDLVICHDLKSTPSVARELIGFFGE